MRYLIIILFFIAFNTTLNAQAPSGSNTSNKRKTQTAKRASAQQQRATNQFHGSIRHNAGQPDGHRWSGWWRYECSPAASAIETNDQTDKAQVKKDTTAGSENRAPGKVTDKKKVSGHSKTRGNL